MMSQTNDFSVRRAIKVMAPAAVLLGLLFSFYFLATFFPGQSGTEFSTALIIGWTNYLDQAPFLTNIHWTTVGWTLLCLAVLTVGLHYFMGWLQGRWHNRHETLDMDVKPRWKRRWTLTVVCVLFLMFIAGVSAVGLAGNTNWLVTSPKPLSSGNRGRFRMELTPVALSVHSYAENHEDKLPAGGIFDDRGRGMHGWQTSILPYLSEERLFQQIDLRKPWNSAENLPAFQTIVPFYRNHDVDRTKDEAGLALSHISANVRVMGGSKVWKLKAIPDELSNTILAGEVADNFKPWGHPCNWRDPALGIGTSPDGFGGQPEYDNVMFLMLDGSVRKIAKNISPEVLRAMSTPDGGEKEQ